MAAALEDFVRDFIDEMSSHINAAGLPLAKLKLGVVSLSQAAGFDSAAARRGQRMWDTRTEILKSADSASIGVVGTRPLDGRTIKQEHLDTVWDTYDLPGSALPSPLHALALRDLSEGRNEVAHGNTDPLTFGRRKTYQDVLRRVEQVEDIAVHVAMAGASYVAAAEYQR